MSSFYDDTIHPKTGEIQRALWMDDYFGAHKYGVRFEGEEHVYQASEIRTVSMFEPMPSKEQER